MVVQVAPSRTMGIVSHPINKEDVLKLLRGTFVLFAVAALCGLFASNAFADGKLTSGTVCDFNDNSSGTLVRELGTVHNGHGTYNLIVDCPMVRDDLGGNINLDVEAGVYDGSTDDNVVSTVYLCSYDGSSCSSDTQSTTNGGTGYSALDHDRLTATSSPSRYWFYLKVDLADDDGASPSEILWYYWSEI